MRALNILSLLLACLSSGAAAQEFPALFDVVKVESTDVLNIRAKPTASAPILDHLAPFERDIEVLGKDATGKWGRIQAGEQMGWASLFYLARQPGQDNGSLPEHLWCAGTEPFWVLEFQAHGDTVLDRFDAKPQSYDMPPLAMAAGTPAAHGSLGRGKAGILALSVVRTHCSDGMSDIEFGLESVVITDDAFGTEVLHGCCNLR